MRAILQVGLVGRFIRDVFFWVWLSAWREKPLPSDFGGCRSGENSRAGIDEIGSIGYIYVLSNLLHTSRADL